MKLYSKFLMLMIVFITISCNKTKKDTIVLKKPVPKEVAELKISIDSNSVSNFFQTYPKLISYQNDVLELYKKQGSKQLWLDNKGLVEFGKTLFDKYRSMGNEGLKSNFPYNEEIIKIFERTSENKLSQKDTDLMITNLYYYYASKVYHGFDEKTTTSLEWLLPRKKLNYQVLSDSIFKHSTINDDGKNKMFSQYYKLREVLNKYKKIEADGGWKNIEVSEDFKSFKVGDSADAF